MAQNMYIPFISNYDKQIHHLLLQIVPLVLL